MRLLLTAFLLTSAALVLVLHLEGRRVSKAPEEGRDRPFDLGQAGRLGPYPASQFLIEPDRFLAATDPAVVSAARADFVLPDDEVFGVVVGGAARAYPLTMLSYHHVVNDVIRGIPVAVTY